MRLTILLGCLLISFGLGARPNQHIISNDSIINTYQLDEAAGLKAFQQKLSTLQAQDDLVEYLQSIKSFAMHQRKLGEFEYCIDLFEKGQLSNIWRSPRDSAEWSRLGWYYVQIGYTYSQILGDYRKAKSTYQEAKNFFSSVQEQSTIVSRFVHWPLATIYTRLGDFAAAEALLNQVISQLLQAEDFERASIAYSDLGILNVNWGRPDRAREAYESGVGLPEISPLSRTIIILNYCDILTNEGEYESAESYIAEAEQLMLPELENENASPRTKRVIAGIYQKRANLKLNQRLYDEALVNFQTELTMLQEYYGNPKRREFGKNYINRAVAFIESAQYPAAINSYQKALEMVLYNYEADTEHSLPEVDQFYAENTIFEALSGMAETYTRWASADGNTQFLEYALECYERCHEAEQLLRRNYLYETSKLINLEESRERSESAIGVAYRLFELTGKKEYLYQAFVFAERNRSSLLREAFRITEATDIAGISEEERAQEQLLKNTVSEAEELAFRLRNQETNDSTLQIAEQDLLNARDSLNTWIKNLEQRHPKYYQLKYADQVPTVAELQQLLPTGELLLEYFVGREHLYIFKIDQSGLNLYELPLPPRLTERIQNWRQSIELYQQAGQDKTAVLAQYQEEAHLLYQDLLAPVLSPMVVVDRLTIISSGILDLVPFEALLTRPVKDSPALSEYPYLIQAYNVGYSYSATLQWRLSQLPQNNTAQAGFAPSFGQGSGWPRLSCSADLLRSTIERSGGRVLAGEEANITQFQQLAPQFGLLHLATHAQANPEQGDFSYIVFSDGLGGYDSLYAKDLYLYDLQAELVILSACETALGTLYNSEGVISLARAFHYAGARSVLTTLWRINEGANCHLLEEFYAELDKGTDKKEALRAAKLAYLKTADARAAHPVYWAGFQLLGNPRPLKQGFPWGYALAALAAILLLGGGWWQYQQRRSIAQAA